MPQMIVFLDETEDKKLKIIAKAKKLSKAETIRKIVRGVKIGDNAKMHIRA